MITIWKTPIVATVEQVLKDLKLQLYGAGLLKEIKNTGSDLMCTCPFHANGKEHAKELSVKFNAEMAEKEKLCDEYVAKFDKFIEENPTLMRLTNGIKELNSSSTR